MTFTNDELWLSSFSIRRVENKQAASQPVEIYSEIPFEISLNATDQFTKFAELFTTKRVLNSLFEMR